MPNQPTIADAMEADRIATRFCADYYDSSKEEISLALAAAREAERQKQKEIDERIERTVKNLWLKEKPCLDAQRIRSAVSMVDRDDLAPEYVWDLLDIAAQRAISAEREKYAAVVEAAIRFRDDATGSNETLNALWDVLDTLDAAKKGTKE